MLFGHFFGRLTHSTQGRTTQILSPTGTARCVPKTPRVTAGRLSSPQCPRRRKP